MRTINLLIASLLLLPGCSAQVKNARTVNVKIDGDCGMCEKTIERVGMVKGESEVDWVVETHMARITFDSTRTDLDAILQRVAQAGYDNEQYLAPKEAYAKLPGCCQYERTMVHADVMTGDANPVSADGQHQHAEAEGTSDQQSNANPLTPVYEAYFTLKDALVASDAKAGTSAAQELGKALAAVDMGTLDHEVHMVWMKVMGPLADQAKAIATAEDLEAQRKAFVQLTDPMAQLVKAAPLSAPIYRDHCPMYEGGADWLSTEKPIRNPFYGSMMMTCGSVKETIAK